jgi:hypothetical protein
MRLSQFIIDVEKPVHVAWWAQEFDVTDEEIVRAVAAVGNRADAVKAHLLEHSQKPAASAPVAGEGGQAVPQAAASGSEVSMPRREAVTRLWIAPAVAVTALPRAGFAANISGHPGASGTAATPAPHHDSHRGRPGGGS